MTDDYLEKIKNELHFQNDFDREETQEWLDSLNGVLQARGTQRARFLLNQLIQKSFQAGISLPFTANTPYINTISVDQQPIYPGDLEIERKIKNIIRWNAMAMVVRANNNYPGIGGHISTYASATTLYETGFNHFFRGKGEKWDGDMVYFQGHASPGIYARAFLEGRLNRKHLENFRRELSKGGGLSSYPHPWLMPDFWEFPTVSLGLGPISAIYQARFNKYLHDRDLKNTENQKIWAFLGDGETDEPEALGAIYLAAREQLDNLIFVVNCNLQRLGKPVRGNHKIVQKLERIFRGAGWNVIKVLWGSAWDPLLANDESGLLIQRMNEYIDEEAQKHNGESGDFVRTNFFGKYSKLLKLVEHLSDEQVWKLRLGGHDPQKVFSAYKKAVESQDAPTVILARTVKDYGFEEDGKEKNITQTFDENKMRDLRDRFDIPITDKKMETNPFYRPTKDSPEIQYLMDSRQKLGGWIPHRKALDLPLSAPSINIFNEFFGASFQEESTTLALMRILSILMKDTIIGKRIVPIVPDDAGAFGMETLLREFGIYSHIGQMSESADIDLNDFYREIKDGQVLEEGITEAGSMASFTAAGTTSASHGIDMIPFFVFYSMFGFQRIADQIWAFGDMRGRGFLIGGVSGRTTLMGEGLQHADGHSHLLASTLPNLVSYDPAFVYELAIIIQDGIRRMYKEREDIFYYITVGNEKYKMPAKPPGSKEGILRGLYKFKGPSLSGQMKQKAHIFGSGSIMNQALSAQTILENNYKVATEVWSATSYNELRRDALEVERWNMLNPNQKQRKPYVLKRLENETGVFVAVSDYVKSVPDQIARWVPGGLFSLGTDGFGRSDTREATRRFFEVDAELIVIAVLSQLVKKGELNKTVVIEAINDLKIDSKKQDPLTA